jgi:hypothetical protein
VLLEKKQCWPYSLQHVFYILNSLHSNCRHNKEERKQRHVAAGKAAKRAAMASERGKFASMAAKKQRRQDRD